MSQISYSVFRDLEGYSAKTSGFASSINDFGNQVLIRLKPNYKDYALRFAKKWIMTHL